MNKLYGRELDWPRRKQRKKAQREDAREDDAITAVKTFGVA